ncbi:MAG TPA: hypothetical protein VMX38_09320 [Verrucomicrobiae bacterium]|nr:hypothetical protein [Verrucomicrobiae bacterium]
MFSIRSKFFLTSLLCASLCATAAGAGPKIHVIVFGKWANVAWSTDAGDKPVTLKIRALIVDGRIREYAIGPPHEVTERLFVVRRAFRVNDSLPEDSAVQWRWQRGGWLLVDRLTGHISPINLPEFDSFFSASSWYRDYVAYCGVSDDGRKTYAIVAQIGRRKPALKKQLSDALPENGGADSACGTPLWQRGPIRVSFEAPEAPKQTFEIRGHVVDMVSDADDEDEGSK